MRAPTVLIPTALACAACVTTPAVEPSSGLPRVPAEAWTVGDAQGIELLARVVQTDTRQPRGREAEAARPLREFLLRAGVDVELLPLGAGRASVFAQVRGGAPAGAAPILLLSHLDTHPATPEAWPAEAGPFSAAIRSDALWGRGVLDGKGLAALHALTLAVLEASEVPLRQPVYMLAVAGGLEADSPGLARAIEQRPGLANAELVLTKGGGSWIDLFGDGRIAHVVTTSERGAVRLRITAATRSDDSGASESPAVARLSRALERVLDRVSNPRLTRPTLDTLEHASDGVYFPKNLVMRSTPLARTFLLQDLAQRSSTAPLVREALVVTHVGSNRDGGRVAPDRAWAVLEGRLLPGRTPGALRAELRAAVQDPDVHVTIESGDTWSGSPTSEAVLAAVRRHARVSGDRAQVTVPAMSPEPTGAARLRRLGVKVYGFTPWVLAPESWARIEGRDEHLPLEDFRRGLRVLTRVVLELAAARDAAAADHSTM